LYFIINVIKEVVLPTRRVEFAGCSKSYFKISMKTVSNRNHLFTTDAEYIGRGGVEKLNTLIVINQVDNVYKDWREFCHLSG